MERIWSFRENSKTNSFQIFNVIVPHLVGLVLHWEQGHQDEWGQNLAPKELAIQ